MNMPWQQICSIALVSIVLSTTVSADIIPDNSRPEGYRAPIEMKIERLPRGVMLLFMAEDGLHVTKASEKQTLTIHEPGTIYAVDETLAAGQIVLRTKRGQLYPLRTIVDGDIPASQVKPPATRHMSCRVTGEESTGFAMDCRPVVTDR